MSAKNALANIDKRVNAMEKVKKRRIPDPIRKQILDQANNQCSNPGCLNENVQVHHIKEWQFYKSHDPEWLVAVCGACHDAIHRGNLNPTEEEQRSWKRLRVPDEYLYAQLTMKPSRDTHILVGPFEILCTGDKSLVVDFGVSFLRFEVKGEKIVMADARICRIDTTNVIDVYSNYVEVLNEPDLELKKRPGRVLITTNKPENFFPPAFLTDADLLSPPALLLEIRILAPGWIVVNGLWHSDKATAYVTPGVWRISTGTDKKPTYMAAYGKGRPPIFHNKTGKPLINHLVDQFRK